MQPQYPTLVERVAEHDESAAQQLLYAGRSATPDLARAIADKMDAIGEHDLASDLRDYADLID